MRTIRTLFLALATAAVSSPAAAQDLASAVLALRGPVTADGNLPITGRLYGGNIINTIVTDGDGIADNFGDGDSIQFTIESTRGTRLEVSCSGARADFQTCMEGRVDDLRRILFPASVSTSVAGRDAAHHYAQQFLLTTAFGINAGSESGRLRRAEIGGLVEHEWYTSDGDAGGRAWQGMYQLAGVPLSVQGRYVHQNDAIGTRATTVSVDYHPSYELNPEYAWRIGASARSGFLYSTSSALDLGSLDFGGGVWTAATKDFARVRLGVGGLFQGSRSVLPESFVGEDLGFLARALSDDDINFDASYGTVLGFIASERMSLNAKVLETRAVASDGERPTSRLFLASVSYLLGGVTPIDAGYKVTTGGGVKAQSVFVQGNFRW
jgi:hypothetical protein